MTEQSWKGCRVSNRLNLWFDDEIHNMWSVTGRDETVGAIGQPHEMVRMAQAILENLPDDEKNGPPLDLETIYRVLPEPRAGDLEEVLSLARRQEGLDAGQRRFIAGALLAIGTQMLP